MLFFFTFVPWLALAATAMVPGWRDWSLTGMTTIAAESCLFQLATMMVFYRLSRVNPLYGLIYPVGGAVAMGTLLNAARCVAAGGSFSWRGTRYRAKSVRGDIETVATPEAV